MVDNNIAAVLHGKDDLRMEEVPIKPPGEGEVQLAMHSVGICGSDVSYWTRGAIGDFVVRKPIILGHEPSGTIIALGEGVTNLKIGDRVAVEPGIACRKCDRCKTGRYNLCPTMAYLGTPPTHGCLARYHTHPADLCFKLPDHVSFDEGVLVQPLSVGIHACKRAGVTVGDHVLVCGAGSIGLVSLLAAKAMGAARIAVTDIDKQRLMVAKSLGADVTILVGTNDVRALAADIRRQLQRVDVTIECSGAETSIQTGIFATRSGGVLVLVGLGKAEATLPIVDAAVREVDIRGVLRFSNTYPTALDMIASGVVNVKPLVTHHFPLEKSKDAFETARTGAGGAIKVIIDCHKE